MQGLVFSVLIMYFSMVLVESEYHTKGSVHQMKEKVTHLHFYLHDILSGKNPSAMLIAKANITNNQNSPTPFGSVFAIDDPLTERPEPTSKVIGNAQGMYVSSALDDQLSIVMYIDFGFTTGEFNGSSFSVFSRNPVAQGDNREIAVVGGREKFRMARGFAKLKTSDFNVSTGDAIIEYKVALFHY